MDSTFRSGGPGLRMPRINRCAECLFALIVTLGIGRTASAASGDLDPTFGVGGRVTLPGLEVGSPDYSMVQQKDGKLVITGGAYVGNDVRQFLVRLESNGVLDAGFVTDGVFISAISSSSGAAVLQQADGKLVVGGSGWLDGQDAVLWRFETDGAMDADFGADGIVNLDLGGWETVTGVVEQTGGQLVIAGTLEPSGGGGARLFFARLNGNGDLDPTFGNGGTLIVGLPVAWNGAISFLQKPGNGLIWVGHLDHVDDVEEGLAVVAITPDGTLQTSFGREGIVEVPAVEIDARHDHTRDGSAALQVDGRIVVAGVTGHFLCCDSEGFPNLFTDGFVLRLTPEGTLDPTFGSDGIVIDSRDLSSAALQGDGKIMVAFDTFHETGLMRLNADGSADEDFGMAGTAVADFRSGGEELVYIAEDLVRQDDGKFAMVAGAAVTETGTGWFPAIARFGSDDAGFPGFIGLDTTRSYASEGAGTVVLFVRRTGGSEGVVSASFATVDDSATQGVDYVAQTGQVTWDDRDTSEKAISIQLIDDAEEEPGERFALELTAATGGAFLTASVSTILIDDDDATTPPPEPTPPPQSPPAPEPQDGGGGSADGLVLPLLLLLTPLARRRHRPRTQGLTNPACPKRLAP